MAMVTAKSLVRKVFAEGPYGQLLVLGHGAFSHGIVKEHLNRQIEMDEEIALIGWMGKKGKSLYPQWVKMKQAHGINVPPEELSKLHWLDKEEEWRKQVRKQVRKRERFNFLVGLMCNTVCVIAYESLRKHPLPLSHSFAALGVGFSVSAYSAYCLYHVRQDLLNKGF